MGKWNFTDHSVPNLTEHLKELEKRAGKKRVIRVPDELTKSAAREAAEITGGVALERGRV